MKRLLVLLVTEIMLIVYAGTTLASGIAIYQGPYDTCKILDDQITTLPSSAFTNVQEAAGRKEVFSRKIHELIPKVESGAYQSAIANLDHDIRNNIQQWIAPTEQSKLFESIENAIASVENASQSTITTSYGKVAGADAYLDCWSWKGIPFAKPPVGKLRWKAPQDPESWHNIRQYNQNYSPCVQSPLSMEWIPLNTITGSEDCLYLDIYAPKTHTGKLPVYFWIHGGGNIVGGAHQFPWCSILANISNVVVVVIQYRLGPFGFFTHPALNPGGTLEDKSGNFAVLDQIKALKWVHQNIAYFGGDPNNVMIAGESAGGYNTLNLMISPLAKGLFHKAMVRSAGIFGTNVEVSKGVVLASAIIDRLLVADGKCKNLTRAAEYRVSMTNAQIESYLRSKKAEQILQVVMYDNGYVWPFNPFIDQVVIPGKFAEVFESGNYNKVPVILGSNEYELKPYLPRVLGSVPLSNGFTWSNVFNVLGLAEPPMTLDELMPPGSEDRDLYEKVGKYASLNWKAAMVDGLARRMREHQDNVYCYWFKWGSPGSGPPPFDFLIGAGHSFEIPFFFGYPDCVWRMSFTPANMEGRMALTKAITSYVASFITSGNPNQVNNGLPVWEGWSNQAGAPKSIIFDGDFTRAKISMTNQEVKKEEVMAQIYALPSIYERDLILDLIWF